MREHRSGHNAFNDAFNSSSSAHGEEVNASSQEPNTESVKAMKEGDAFFASQKAGRFTNGTDLIAAALSSDDE